MKCWEEMKLWDQPSGRKEIFVMVEVLKWLQKIIPHYRLFHDGAERIEGSCSDNLNIVKAGGFACVTEDLSAKSIVSSDFTKTRKCNFYASEPLTTFRYGMTFPV